MKKLVLISMMALMTVASYGRNHVSADAVIASDTIYYSSNKVCVPTRTNASYYRLLKKDGAGINKQDLFQDYYLNGTLKAEGGYNFVDLGNDKNTIFNGEVTTYYPNGKEKVHGKYVNGKRQGYFTVMMHDGSVAVCEFVNGQSKYDYFTVTRPNGNMEQLPIEEIKSLLQ